MIVIASPWFLIVGIPVLVVYIAIQVIFILTSIKSYISCAFFEELFSFYSVSMLELHVS